MRRVLLLLYLAVVTGFVLAQAPPQAEPAPAPLAVTTLFVPGAIAERPYFFLLTSNGSDAQWAVTGGSVPPGLVLNTEGRLSGTPSAAGEFGFDVRVTDARNRSAQRRFTLIVSEAAPQYGNAGDPYLTEGGAPDKRARKLDQCGPLAEGASYLLVRDVSAKTAGDVCFLLQGGRVKLDLGGHTVTGRIFMNANLSGTTIFHGSVRCDWDGRGAWTGCVNLLSTSTASAPLRVHHLTLKNSAHDDSRALYIDWSSPDRYNDPRQPFSIRLYHISSRVDDAPDSVRTYNLGVIAAKQAVEMAYNDMACGPDASACQGGVCYATANCVFHGNRAVMEPNQTGENGRALNFDGHTMAGDAWNNLLTVHNSRGVRVRDSTNIIVHNNVFREVAGTAVHLGDPDRGTNDVWISVERNVFEMAGGTAFMVRNAKGHVVAQQNTFRRSQPCPECKGELAHVRAPLRPKDVTQFILCDNKGVSELAAPQVLVERGAEVFLSNSGQAGGEGKAHESAECPAGTP